MAKLTQYEIEREANIRRNEQLLADLELKQAVEDLGFTKSKVKEPEAKPVPDKKRKRAAAETVSEPRRKSVRLRHVVEPNETPAQRKKREAEVEAMKAKEEEERLAEEERKREARKPRHQDLTLDDVLQEDEESDELSKLLQDLEPQPLRAVVEDDQKVDKDVEELREKFKNVKIVSRAKVTTDRVYSAAYHPVTSKDLLFFGDKHGQLGIWDARAPVEEEEEADEEGGGKVWRLQAHWPATSQSSISCIKFDPLNSQNVLTSSYDCTLRTLSFESGISRELYTSDSTLLTSFDIMPTGNELFISDAVGGVTHLDLREPKTNARWYGLSEAKIGSVSINPTRPNYLVTASNSRSLRIWDTRKLFKLGDAEEYDNDLVTEYVASKGGKGTLCAEWAHKKSASSAYWDPAGRSVVSTSYDDTIRLWDFKSEAFNTKDGVFPSSKPFTQISHDCQTGKWLTILRAQWSSNPDVHPHFTVGNMRHSLDVFGMKGELIARLHDKTKVTAVQAVTCSHPSLVGRVASGNASGRCVLWDAVEED